MKHLPAIKKLLLGMAEFYGEPMSDQRLSLFAQVLQEFTPEEVDKAIGTCLKDPTQVRMPLPAKIKEQISPTLSIDVAAQELLQRCVKAVSAYGYANPTEARHYVGDIAWRALGGQSGWVQFCSAGDHFSAGIEIGTARAQLRESLKAKLFQEFPIGRVPKLTPPQTEPKVYLPVLDQEDFRLKEQGFLNNQERDKRLLELQNQIKFIGKPVRE